ncbi:MAG: transposase [Gammaproteobacteria bacterium]|nr:transposase [Gammaproteobacteria bacterium]
MTNYIHFLVTPENPESISRAMSVIGSRYAYCFNKTYKRTGTIWEGRHKSSLIQSNRYFLTCCRCIELNQVVAGMVNKPEEYKWSSDLVSHDQYLKLGIDAEVRSCAYRGLFKDRLSDYDVHLIQNASEYCQPVGDDHFRIQIEEKYGVILGQPFRGRPKKEEVKK